MLLTTAFIGVGLSACSGPPVRSGHSGPGSATSSLISLSCADSAGQQGEDHETVIGGVEGLVLPGSDDPAGLYPIRASDGRRYFVYKAFLAVSASAAPYVTVSVTRPAGARLVYGSRLHGARCGCLCAGRASAASSAASLSPGRPA
jgi:hypothetical protein